MKVFVTGGTSYIGSRLIPRLIQRGDEVEGLARKGSETRLPAGTTPAIADPLKMEAYTEDHLADARFPAVGGGESPGGVRILDVPKIRELRV